MSRGKYSPFLPKHTGEDNEIYKFNAFKEIPAIGPFKEGEYNEAVHFANYDSNGYDYYGYSALNRDGEYVGIGMGVDSAGYTESDYLNMSDEEWNSI
mgnify:CR=1 FL=1